MKKNLFCLTSLLGVSASLILSTGALANAKASFVGQAQILLTAHEKKIANIAFLNHDRNFIMVDKLRGRLIVFEDCKPTFTAHILTGASLADTIPERTFHLSLEEHRRADKVTPAGFFTVSRDDNEHGGTLKFNEITEAVWLEAIHVCTNPARCSALDSQEKDNAQGKNSHVTTGCVDVSPETMDYLLRWTQDSIKTDLYVMPEDPGKISDYFHPPLQHPGLGS